MMIMGSMRKTLRNALFRVRQTVQLDRALILQGQMRAEQILARGKLAKLSDAGFGVFAQTDEDGILSWLIDRLGVRNETFIEFGVHDYRESNTRYLLMTRAWRGLVIDGDPANIEAIRSDEVGFMRNLEAVASFITRENINDIIANAGFSGRVGILSVDIDGVDYWVLERINVEADIIVVEYNDFLGDAPVTVPYDPQFTRWSATPHGSYWGASLAAFRHLLEPRGYVFVGSNLIGINGFFVHPGHAAHSSGDRLGTLWCIPTQHAMPETRAAGSRQCPTRPSPMLSQTRQLFASTSTRSSNSAKYAAGCHGIVEAANLPDSFDFFYNHGGHKRASRLGVTNAASSARRAFSISSSRNEAASWRCKPVS